MSNVSKLPAYDTILFTDVYADATSFINDYNNVGIPTTIQSNSVSTLYYL